MRWLGLVPILFVVVSLVLYGYIATIPVGPRGWRLAWAILGAVGMVHIWARVDNVIGLVYGHDPLDPLRTLQASLIASGHMIFAIILWDCLKPRPLKAPVPVAQVVMSWDGYIIGWNDAATDLLGFTAEDAVKDGPEKQELATLIIPEDLMVPYMGEMIPAREAHRRGLTHFHETGQSAILNKEIEMPALHKAGHRIDVALRVTAHMTEYGQTFLGQLVEAKKLMT